MLEKDGMPRESQQCGMIKLLTRPLLLKSRSSASSSLSVTTQSRTRSCPFAYLAQPYSITLVPPRFHRPFVGLSVSHKTETGDLNSFGKAITTEPAGDAMGPWIMYCCV
jgi:hypothetical protein